MLLGAEFLEGIPETESACINEAPFFSFRVAFVCSRDHFQVDDCVGVLQWWWLWGLCCR